MQVVRVVAATVVVAVLAPLVERKSRKKPISAVVVVAVAVATLWGDLWP